MSRPELTHYTCEELPVLPDPTRGRPHRPRPGTATGMQETARAARYTWGCPRRVSKSLQSWTPPFPCPCSHPGRRHLRPREAGRPCWSARKLQPAREGSSFREGGGERGQESSPNNIKSFAIWPPWLQVSRELGGCPQQELGWGGALGEMERQSLPPVRPVLPASPALGWRSGRIKPDARPTVSLAQPSAAAGCFLGSQGDGMKPGRSLKTLPLSWED